MWKKFIEYILLKFDIGVYRLSTVQNNSHEDAFEHNSLEWKEKTISIEGVKAYLDNADRMEFYSSFLDFCVENGVVFDNADIVDLGCSGGSLLEMIDKKYSPKSVTGYDSSKKTVEIAKKLFPSPNYVHFDVLKDESKKTFDISICTEVLEHLLDPEKAINNLLLMTRKVELFVFPFLTVEKILFMGIFISGVQKALGFL